MGKQILLLGIGQTGCEVGEAFLHRMQSDTVGTRALAVDTDARTFVNTELAKKVPMVSDGSLHATIERLGSDWVRDFFPADWEKDGTDFAKRLPMDSGANLWRMKAYVSFLDFLGNRKMAERFHSELNEVADLAGSDGIELLTVASTVGGTGSGLFLPVTLYVKKYLKSIGARIVSSNCLLVMPKVYEQTLSSEQRIKGYANSYAALRELNAVNIAAFGEGGNSHPPIGFKLGDERAKCGVLFDTESPEFCNKESAPFDKVILFDRTPGVNSVNAHINIIADVLVSVSKCGAELSTEANENENSTAVYEGISLTKVSYAPDTIVKYISKVQTEAALNGEVAALCKEIKLDAKKRSIEARSLRSRGDVDEIEQYAEAFIFRAKSKIEDLGCADALIGRVTKLSKDAEVSHSWDDDFRGDVKRIFDELCKSMDLTLDCYELHELEKIINPELSKKDDEEDEESEIVTEEQTDETENTANTEETEVAEDTESLPAEDANAEDTAEQIPEGERTPIDQDTAEVSEVAAEESEPDGEERDEEATEEESEEAEEASEEEADEEAEEEVHEDAAEEEAEEETLEDEPDVEEEVPTKKKKIRKKKEKPLTEKQRRARLLTNASEVRTLIEGYAKSLRTEIAYGKDEFCASLKECGNELSVIDSIIAPGGKALHPSYALVRLCLLYTYLKKVVRDVPQLADNLSSDGELSEEIMIVDDAAAESRYTRAGKRRLEVLTASEIPDDPDLIMHKRNSKKRFLINEGERVLRFKTDDELRRKLADNEQQFSEDVEYVRAKLFEAAKYLRYMQAREVLAELITGYRRLADAMSARSDDMTVDVKLAAINGGADTGVLVNVATSAVEKENICVDYLASYRANTEKVSCDDEKIGRIFLDYVKNGGNGDDLISDVEKLYSERFRNSEYYTENIEKNIITAVVDSMRGKFGDTGLGFGRIFRERFSPLCIIRGDDYPERRDLNNSTVAIFSKGVWDYVGEHGESFDNDTPREFFEKKMYDAGEYRGEATYSDRIDDSEFWIRRETSNVALHLLETFNESARDATAYAAYERAKETAKLRSTAMWDPDLIYRRDDDMPLPMISPTARHEYEISVAKAVLYGLVSGELYVSDLEGVGSVYFTYIGGTAEPVTVDGAVVREKQIKELFSFAYANPSFTRNASDGFRTLFEGRYSLGVNFAGHRELASSLARSERMTKLSEAFSTLLIKLYSSKSLEISGWARFLAEAISSTILGIAKNGECELDEKSSWVYNALVERMMSMLIKEAKGERAKALVTWLNDGGYLLMFEPPCDFKNYEI